MNSIQDLNGFGGTSITFTDNRTPGPIFDRPLTRNQVVNINQNDDHPIPEGINILDVIRPSDASVTYTIDVSSVPGSTVDWPTVPAGCVVTNPSLGVYSISGINSKAIWDQVKNPDYIPDPAFVGVFSYTATISWNPAESVYWVINATINDITNMTVPEDFYFLGGDSGSVTGNPEILDNYATTWTVTATPSSLGGYETLATAGSGGTSSFNSTTKVLTITGTKTQVNSHLNSLTFTSLTTSKSDFTIQYLAVNDTTGEGDVKTQAWYSTEYLTATRGDAGYTVDTTVPLTVSSITDGPLITDVGASGLGQYTMTIVPTPSSAVTTMSSTGRPGWTYNQTINCPQPQSPYATGARWPDGIGFSSDSNYMAVGFRLHWDNFSPIVRSSQVYIYTKSGDDFVYSTTVAPTGEVYNEAVGTMGTLEIFGTEVLLDADGDTMVVSAPVEDVSSSSDTNEGVLYVFTRSGSSWSQQTRLRPSSSRAEDQIGKIGRVSLSADGNTIVASAPRTSYGGGLPDAQGAVFTWTRAGSTWTQQTTLNGSDALITDAYGTEIAMDSTASTLAVVSYSATNPYSGYVYVYTGSAGTWTQQTKITSFDGSASRIRYVSISSDGNTLAASNGLNIYIFTRTAGVWTFLQKITSAVTSRPFKFADNDTYLVTKIGVYKLVDGEYELYETPSITGYNTASSDGEFIAGVDQTVTVSGNANAGALYLYSLTNVGTTWNSSTKTLTLTGNKTQINEDIDTIMLTPAQSYENDFILTYTVTTPAFIIDTRTQDVIAGA